MRRLPRILLNVATAILLPLCAFALWSKWNGSIAWGLTSDGWVLGVYADNLVLFAHGTHWPLPLEWLALVVVAVLAARLEMHRRARSERRRTRDMGLCPACGYDLRATPDRCPECGIAPATPA